MSLCPSTLKDTGELAFIRSIRHLMPTDGGFFQRSVGDDCLVTAPLGDRSLLATIDTFVDGVHFRPEWFTWRGVGRRCMTASVSDIAAMAGTPTFSLVSLSLPSKMVENDAEELFSGLVETTAAYGCPVVGGETTSTPGPATITVTVLGTCLPGSAVPRSGARPGDGVYVTGTLGCAMAGLMAYERPLDGFNTLKEKFAAPLARVTVARALAERFRLTSMIDISDGVVTDLGHLCEESGCGATIDSERIPQSPEFIRFAESVGVEPIFFALASGEEFELLFTSDDPVLPESLSIEGVTITRIGEVTDADDGIQIMDSDGKSQPLLIRGYEHFSS